MRADAAAARRAQRLKHHWREHVIYRHKFDPWKEGDTEAESAQAFVQLLVAFEEPAVDPRTGLPRVLLGDDPKRVTAAQELDEGLGALTQKEGRDRALRFEGGYLDLAETADELLKECWKARKATFGPKGWKITNLVDAFLKRAQPMKPEQYAAAKNAEAPAAAPPAP